MLFRSVSKRGIFTVLGEVLLVGDSPGLLHGRAGGPETTPSGRGKDLGRLWRVVRAPLSADSVPDDP